MSLQKPNSATESSSSSDNTRNGYPTKSIVDNVKPTCPLGESFRNGLFPEKSCNPSSTSNGQKFVFKKRCFCPRGYFRIHDSNSKCVQSCNSSNIITRTVVTTQRTTPQTEPPLDVAELESEPKNFGFDWMDQTVEKLSQNAETRSSLPEPTKASPSQTTPKVQNLPASPVKSFDDILPDNFAFEPVLNLGDRTINLFLEDAPKDTMKYDFDSTAEKTPVPVTTTEIPLFTNPTNFDHMINTDTQQKNIKPVIYHSGKKSEATKLALVSVDQFNNIQGPVSAPKKFQPKTFNLAKQERRKRYQQKKLEQAGIFWQNSAEKMQKVENFAASKAEILDQKLKEKQRLEQEIEAMMNQIEYEKQVQADRILKQRLEMEAQALSEELELLQALKDEAAAILASTIEGADETVDLRLDEINDDLIGLMHEDFSDIDARVLQPTSTSAPELELSTTTAANAAESTIIDRLEAFEQAISAVDLDQPLLGEIPTLTESPKPEPVVTSTIDPATELEAFDKVMALVDLDQETQDFIMQELEKHEKESGADLSDLMASWMEELGEDAKEFNIVPEEFAGVVLEKPDNIEVKSPVEQIQEIAEDVANLLPEPEFEDFEEEGSGFEVPLPEDEPTLPVHAEIKNPKAVKKITKIPGPPKPKTSNVIRRVKKPNLIVARNGPIAAPPVIKSPMKPNLGGSPVVFTVDTPKPEVIALPEPPKKVESPQPLIAVPDFNSPSVEEIPLSYVWNSDEGRYKDIGSPAYFDVSKFEVKNEQDIQKLLNLNVANEDYILDQMKMLHDQKMAKQQPVEQLPTQTQLFNPMITPPKNFAEAMPKLNPKPQFHAPPHHPPQHSASNHHFMAPPKPAAPVKHHPAPYHGLPFLDHEQKSNSQVRNPQDAAVLQMMNLNKQKMMQKMEEMRKMEEFQRMLMSAPPPNAVPLPHQFEAPSTMMVPKEKPLMEPWILKAQNPIVPHGHWFRGFYVGFFVGSGDGTF